LACPPRVEVNPPPIARPARIGFICWTLRDFLGRAAVRIDYINVPATPRT
jgi:hypothetical protein